MTPLLIGLVMASTTVKAPPIVWYAEPETTKMMCGDKMSIACYFFDTNMILMSTEISKEFWPHVYWHEYGHFLYGRDEVVAEAFAVRMLK